MNSEELKFLMNVFDKIQDIKEANPTDPNLPEIERIFSKHAKDSLVFQKVRLTDIHELSIEKVISKQAKEFYTSIPFFNKFSTEIQEQLFQDYSQMEHQRRRDNFERFSQCIYQQVEAIVSFLWNNGALWNYILGKRKELMFTEWKDYVKTLYSKGSTVQRKLFQYYNNENRLMTDEDYDKEFIKPTIFDSKQNNFQVKLRVVLFLLYFSEDVTEKSFDSIYSMLYEIIVVRNTFHRGPGSFTKNQEKILNEVNQNHSIYYHKFFGVLSDFIFKTLNSTNISIV